jgi:hypothetical protein
MSTTKAPLLRLLTLSVLAATLGALAFTTAPALAAEPAPEAPTTTGVKTITATTAVLEGTLNPGASAKAGWYFAYSTEIVCAVGATTPLEPEVTGKAVKEHIEVTGLEPNREYTFCMVATNEAGAQATPSVTELKFKTEPLPPTVEGLTSSNVKATEATLEATVNPNNEPTECKFQYGETKVTENEIPCAPELLKGYGGQGVSSTQLNEKGEVTRSIGGLNPETTYKYRIVTNSGAGEGTGEGTFETALPPNTPEKAKATEITTTTATLNGLLNPTAERTKDLGSYEFVYRQSSTECRYARSAEEIKNLEEEIAAAEKLKEGEPTAKNKETLAEKRAELRNDEKKERENKATPQEAASGAEGAPVDAEVAGLVPGAVPYTFCLLARNEAGEEAIGPPETFTTVAIAPAVKSESASVVEAAGATLNAEIVPEGAATTTHFEYLSQAQFKADGNTFAAGTETTSESGSIGSDDAEHYASARISESGRPALQPSTTYDYRVVATNSQGTAVGDLNEHGEEIVETFTTPAAPSANATNPAPPASTTPGGGGAAAAAPSSSLPALGGRGLYPSIAQYEAQELKETTTTPKPLTKAQELSKALKACKRDKKKSKRKTCEKQARKKY